MVRLSGALLAAFLLLPPPPALALRAEAPPLPAGTVTLPAGADLRLLEARTALEEGRIERAIAPLESLLAERPASPAAHHLLAAARLKQGRLAQAIAHLTAAASDAAYPDRGEALLTLGALRLKRLEFVRARAALREACALLPEDPRPFKYMGILEASLDRPAEAAAAFAKAARLDPADPELKERSDARAAPTLEPAHRLAVAEALLAEGDAREADRQIERVLAEHPANETALCLKGLLLRERGRPADAIALLSGISPATQDLYAECQVQIGLAHAALADHPAATAALRKALDVRPDLAVAWTALARSLDALGKTAEAEIAYETSLREEYDQPSVQARLAQLRGDGTGRVGADGLPEARSLHFRGRARLARGDFDGALDAFDAAFRRDSNDVELLRDMIALHRALELPHLAKLYLGRLERIAPADPAVPTARGFLLRAEGKTVEAELQFRAALARNPVEPLALTGLALLSLDRGAAPEAFERFERVYRLGERNPTVLEGYCDALERLGRLAEAEPAVRQLLRADPGNARALEWLEMLSRPEGPKGSTDHDPDKTKDE